MTNIAGVPFAGVIIFGLLVGEAAFAQSGFPQQGILYEAVTPNWISVTREGLHCVTPRMPGAKPQCVKIGGPEIGYNPIEALHGLDGKPGGTDRAGTPRSDR